MTRIFPILAALNALALVVSYTLGWISKARGGVLNPDDPTYLIHFLAGLITALLTLLVHCIIFTYFLGTGRWVKEVAIAYSIPDEPWPKLTRELKRQTFPPALFSMLFVIATAAAGAAAQVQVWPWYYHFGLATTTLLVNLKAFIVESLALRENVAALEAIQNEVDRIRAERGLVSNAEALREEEAAARLFDRGE